MTVSFTGINHLRVAQKTSQKYGLCISASKEIEPHIADVTTVKIRCELTNDSKGNDLSEYQNVLKKANKIIAYNPQKPNEIELHMDRYDIKDDVIPISNSVLKINNQPIPITKREDLALYTYLAKLTRRMSSMASNSPKLQDSINKVNDSVAENAMYYIDNIL